jgi:hypothetical protein
MAAPENGRVVLQMLICVEQDSTAESHDVCQVHLTMQQDEYTRRINPKVWEMLHRVFGILSRIMGTDYHPDCTESRRPAAAVAQIPEQDYGVLC